MNTGFAVLRPEPGNAATADALIRGGHDVFRLPLFAVRPLAWQPPDPASFDALLLTSANAVRHAGAGITAVGDLPVVAVGAATAAAARDAGLRVMLTGAGDGADAVTLARRAGLARLLHLAGRDKHAFDGITAIATYASEALVIPPEALARLRGRVALLHSPRAAHRLATLVGRDRAEVAIAALSDAIVRAAGDGWRATTVASAPTDAALRRAAMLLAAEIDRSNLGEDKRP